MGVGKPDDIVGAVERGIDISICVLPTRSGRTGQASPKTARSTSATRSSPRIPAPLDPESPTAGWSKAYLHHSSALASIGRDADDRSTICGSTSG